jgi:fluoride ion exporter CrcB/FEX
MVLMMDGAANPYLGSQVLAALFGYVLGLQTSLVSFRAGRTLGAWSHAGRNPHIFDAAVSKREMRPRRHHAHLFWMTPLVLFVAVGALVALFVLGDAYWGIPYYRELWIGSLLAPVGTLLRYKLATLNGKLAIRGEYWFPSGTFLANFFGSILSAAFTAWAFVQSQDEGAQSWEILILNAVTLGAAGCLSTVSTYAKECVELGEKNPPYDKKQFLYSHGTMLSCCLIGLLVYSPIVRFA